MTNYENFKENVKGLNLTVDDLRELQNSLFATTKKIQTMVSIDERMNNNLYLSMLEMQENISLAILIELKEINK